MSVARRLRLCPALILLCLLTACVDIPDRHPPELEAIRPRESAGFGRAGHVYCLLGWLGIWSHGMDVIALCAHSELNRHVTSLASSEWRKRANCIQNEHFVGRWSEPVVLIGHSLGADNQIRVDRALNGGGVPVDLLVLIDPDALPHIPPNVRRCVNIFKSHRVSDAVPVFRGTRVNPDRAQTVVKNIDLRLIPVGFDASSITHFNIAQVTGVQDMVLAEIAKTCPLRYR